MVSDNPILDDPLPSETINIIQGQTSNDRW